MEIVSFKFMFMLFHLFYAIFNYNDIKWTTIITCWDKPEDKAACRWTPRSPFQASEEDSWSKQEDDRDLCCLPLRRTLPDWFPHRTEILQSVKEQGGHWSHTSTPATSLRPQLTSQTTHRHTLQHKQAEASTLLGWTFGNCTREWRFSSQGQYALPSFSYTSILAIPQLELIIEKQVSTQVMLLSS